VELISKMNRLGINVTDKFGFSVSLSDMDLPLSAKDKIKDILNKEFIVISPSTKLHEVVKDLKEKNVVIDDHRD